MPIGAEPRNYGPLSIEDDDDIQINDDDHVPSPSSSPPRIVVHRCLCCFDRRRKIWIVLLFLLCVAASALLAAKELFHLSFLNLLRTMVGGDRKGSNLPLSEAVCLSYELYGGTPSAIEKNLTTVTIEGLDFNRKALAFDDTLTDVGGIISSGFLWDEEDASTTKWRPQGVTTFHGSNGRRYVIVSWYGRKDEGYSSLGGRISIVDISDIQNATSPSQYPYCHVLLVDEYFCTLPNIHVGGVEQIQGTLYVADSRKGMQSILEFDLLGLYESPSSVFGYRYLLRQSSSFRSPTKPSFISYDVDNDKFVVGTYARCGKKIGFHVDSEKCFRQSTNRLVWFKKNNDESKSSESKNGTDLCWHYFSEMQGAASARVGNFTIVWVSSSYGPIGDSHLHVVNTSSSFTGECPDLGNVILDDVSILRFPPGLEDLHIEQTEGSRYMWMSTEFGTRMTFATPLDSLHTTL